MSKHGPITSTDIRPPQPVAAVTPAAPPSSPNVPRPTSTVPDAEPIFARLAPQDPANGAFLGSICIPHVSGSHSWRAGEWGRVSRPVAEGLAVQTQSASIGRLPPLPCFQFADESTYQAIRDVEIEAGDRASAHLAALSLEAQKRAVDFAERMVRTARSHATLAFIK